ncbi:MAG TPA: HD-GYP domain-containing protein [Candidatus Tyrphobacter sp.]
MLDPQTISQLGEVLGRDLGALVRSATEHVTLREVRALESTESSLETLLDRLCLSLTLTKPIGLITWGEREVKRVGRAGASDMLAAATHAISIEARRFSLDSRRVLASLEALAAEVVRGAFGPQGAQVLAPEVDRPTDVMLAMLAERDAVTCCHSKATAVWARRIGTAMGLSGDAVEFVELCGLLHDVGKIGTPDAILNKPGPLTVQEWEIMKNHSAAGARIVESIPSLRRCAPTVRSHHERFDGTGYPDRLRGTAIPLEARIVAVAGSYHAMITDRPYRAAINPREALKILEEGKGVQWDAAVVDALHSLFERKSATAGASRPRLVHSA